jgi:hypothetical protein
LAADGDLATGGRGVAAAAADGWEAGVWVALGEGVPAEEGVSADRMPGMEAWAADGSDPDGWATDACEGVG